MSEETLQRTPLYECHVEAGARLFGFAGWEMPVLYAGVIEEHRAVRNGVGLFDVSHMGEIMVRGAGAEAFLDRLTPNHVARLSTGRIHYSGLLTEDGTYIDDLLVYRMGDEEFMLVLNAANVGRDFDWIESHADGTVAVENVSEDYALLALQGPRAADVLAPLTGADLTSLRYYRFAVDAVDGFPALVSRTGYTGEDGFELYLRPQDGPAVWRRLMAAGRSHGIAPAGLGARDTLRLEAAMALYGHELDDRTTPWEAGLDWVVRMGKGEFIGRDALARQKEEGLERRLIGLEVLDRGIARQGHPVRSEDGEIGVMTSGTICPTLEKAVGMAWVPPEFSQPGTTIIVDVRGRHLAARVVELPFYRRP
jgi:aminomethyltransferase